MAIANFQDLIKTAQSQQEPQRLLFLFAQANAESTSDSGQQRGTITPMICVDMLPSEVGDFKALVKEADGINKNWNFVFIAALSGVNGIEPSSEEAGHYLERMTTTISSGLDVDKYLVFDRDENPVSLTPG
ncbi:MAG: hypothetical protein KDD43_14295 [Bdellovibrionales bacterium]|nr:hypothetical protein [Bdellovibrionales bacterium]